MTGLYTFPPGNVRWTPRDIAALICGPGYMAPDWRALNVIAVALAESGGDPLAIGTPIWRPGNPRHLAVALGMWQLLTYDHVERSAMPSYGWPRMLVSECFDPFASWDRAWLLLNTSRPGTWHYNLRWWSAFTGSGLPAGTPLPYLAHQTAARHGLNAHREANGMVPL